MNGTVARELLAAPIPGSATEAVSGEALLAGAAEAVHAAGDDASLPLDGLSWLPAVDPPVMCDCLAIKEHLVNASARAGGLMNPAHYERPGFYKGSVSGLIGHEAVAPWPAYTQWMDYKLKLGFVVGRPGRNLTPEEAPSHLFGVTIFNDFSARTSSSARCGCNCAPPRARTSRRQCRSPTARSRCGPSSNVPGDREPYALSERAAAGHPPHAESPWSEPRRGRALHDDRPQSG